jgi:uncharacterized protein
MPSSYDITQLSELNPWWIDRDRIHDDINLDKIAKMKHPWDPRLRHFFNLDQDVIYALRGPRQVGKPTMIKIMIRDLLIKRKVNPENVFFWSFEGLNEEDLADAVSTYLDWRINAKEEHKYLFLDEICQIKQWSQKIVRFANQGKFRNSTVIVSGSHAMDLKYSFERMPGRRGGVGNEPLDKILVPMKFSEYVCLIDPKMGQIMFDLDLNTRETRHKTLLNLFRGKVDPIVYQLDFSRKELDAHLDDYLMTGGFPSAVNQYHTNRKIDESLYNVYLTSIIGDLQKYRMNDEYLKQVSKAILNVYTTRISWNALTEHTGIGSRNTVEEYVRTLEELFVGGVVYRWRMEKGRMDPKSNKKVYIHDPFLFHTLRAWSHTIGPYFQTAKPFLFTPEGMANLIESVVYDHLCRLAYDLRPRDLFDPKDVVGFFRDKKHREVDFILIHENKKYPIEVKYRNKITANSYANFAPFGPGTLISKQHLTQCRKHSCIPASIFLMLV